MVNVAIKYLYLLKKKKRLEEALEQAEGWLDRYRDLSGDSDPITLSLFGEVGEILLLKEIQTRRKFKKQKIPEDLDK